MAKIGPLFPRIFMADNMTIDCMMESDVNKEQGQMALRPNGIDWQS